MPTYYTKTSQYDLHLIYATLLTAVVSLPCLMTVSQLNFAQSLLLSCSLCEQAINITDCAVLQVNPA